MTLLAATAGLLAGTACGCVNTQKPQPQSPTVSVRSVARGAVLTLDFALQETGRACHSVAVSKSDQVLADKCLSGVTRVGAAIKTAGSGVDAWTDADTGNVPCALQDAATGLEQFDSMLVSSGVPVPAVVDQGIELARSLAPQCTRQTDAGVGG
jgi:hypothetical protein